MTKTLLIFTLAHTAISLVAILAGFAVVGGLTQGRGRQLWTFLFLCSTTLTVLTGFLFPFHGVTPALILGVISLLPLTLAIVARYRFRLAGAWRGIYVVSVMAAFYFNFFVLIVQAFQKIPALHVLAPTQTELPFKVAQLTALMVFIVMGIRAFKKFRVPSSLNG